MNTIPFPALFQDNEFWEGIDGVLDSGFCEESVIHLIRHCCVLSREWCTFQKTAGSDESKDLERAANTAKKLNDQLQHLFSIPFWNDVPISKILQDLENYLNDQVKNKSIKKPSRNQLSEFIRREIVGCIIDGTPLPPKKKPIAATRKIINAVLIKFNLPEVSLQQIKDTYKGEIARLN